MKTVKVSARWTGEKLNFVGTDARGKTVEMGGDNVTPGQMLLLALAGCTGMDVVSILQKKRQQLSDLEVEVVAEQDDEYPKPYQNIKVTFTVKGKEIDSKSVARAIELSTDKYCVVGQTLHQETDIVTDFEVEG